MQRTLICPICGIEFVTDKNAQKYCSSKCRRKANSAPISEELREFLCSWCGKPFTSLKRKKYCSAACRICANKRHSHKNSTAEKPILSISRIAALSRREGMSYGQYVCKYQLR